MSEVDFSTYTEAELLESLGNIHPRRSGENFTRLKAALEARGYVVNITDFGWGTATLPPGASSRSLHAAIRFGPGRGPVAWVEPARNDYRLVGTGTISIDNATVHITGRRLGWILGVPLTRTIELDREHILNVEVNGNAVRFEYREKSGELNALTLQCGDAPTAERIRELLPSERTTHYHPKLPAELEFDRRVLSRTPRVPITEAIVLVNVLVFLATVAFGAELFFPVGNMQIAWGSNFGPFTTDGECWRLLTSTFIHFGILHLGFNLWFLAATGPLVERLYGSVSYLVLYTVSGIAASLASISWHPALNSAGASGAIFGMYGALLAALVRGGESIPPSVVAPLTKSALVFTISALAAGFLLQGIDNAAHVGGLATGFILGVVLARRLTITENPPARASTLLAGTAVAAFLLCAGTLLAFRAASSLDGEGLFWHTQHWIVRNELVAIDRWLTLSELARQKKVSDAQYAEEVESQVLPMWREAERRMQKVHVPDESPTSAKLQYLRAFVTSRRTAYELCVKGAREHNADTTRRCTDELARGDQMTRKRS